MEITLADKELLIKDLCGRLPYDVKVEHTSGIIGTLTDINVHQTYNEDDTIKDYLCYTNFFGDESCKIEYFKPYLFPVSSMTTKQKAELTYLTADIEEFNLQVIAQIDWLNKNHFDYRGLIKKGLAIDATNKNIY